jgi:hypothetical protein
MAYLYFPALVWTDGPGINRAKTKCCRGHLFSGYNLAWRGRKYFARKRKVWVKYRQRICRKCDNEGRSKRRKAERAKRGKHD